MLLYFGTYDGPSTIHSHESQVLDEKQKETYQLLKNRIKLLYVSQVTSSHINRHILPMVTLLKISTFTLLYTENRFLVIKLLYPYYSTIEFQFFKQNHIKIFRNKKHARIHRKKTEARALCSLKGFVFGVFCADASSCINYAAAFRKIIVFALAATARLF